MLLPENLGRCLSPSFEYRVWEFYNIMYYFKVFQIYSDREPQLRFLADALFMKLIVPVSQGTWKCYRRLYSYKTRYEYIYNNTKSARRYENLRLTFVVHLIVTMLDASVYQKNCSVLWQSRRILSCNLLFDSQCYGLGIDFKVTESWWWTLGDLLSSAPNWP